MKIPGSLSARQFVGKDREFLAWLCTYRIPGNFGATWRFAVLFSEEHAHPYRHEAVVAERLQSVPRIHTPDQAALELKGEAIRQATLGLNAGCDRSRLHKV